jgi:hypothetical protein
MTTVDGIPPADSEVWRSAVSTLEDGLSLYPVRSIEGVRFAGAGVSNTAVTGTATEVILRVTRDRVPGQREPSVWEIAMPPAFARYLAGLLDAHARYIQTAPHPT